MPKFKKVPYMKNNKNYTKIYTDTPKFEKTVAFTKKKNIINWSKNKKALHYLYI